MADSSTHGEQNYHTSRVASDSLAENHESSQVTSMPIEPTLQYEIIHWQAGRRRIVGSDAVGLACAAGPVVAAAVIVDPDQAMIAGVRDSKTLSSSMRERLFERILDDVLAVGIGMASAAEIDELNIYHAGNLATQRAIMRCGGADYALLDGLPIRDFEQRVGPHQAIVKGDGSCYSIAAASIIAKVVRDRLMQLLAVAYPGYDWEHNVGYTTPRHRAGLLAHGVTPLHRRSWAPVKDILALAK
jgi:ribonuclease HII